MADEVGQVQFRHAYEVEFREPFEGLKMLLARVRKIPRNLVVR